MRARRAALPSHPAAQGTTAVPPAIYGDLSDEARAAYGRWILPLFSLTEHVGWCPFGCQGARYVCDEGRSFYAAEQQRWREWNETRPEEVKSDAS